jgi:hypothetical protein
MFGAPRAAWTGVVAPNQTSLTVSKGSAAKSGRIPNPERLMTPTKNIMARFLLPAIVILGCVLIALSAVNAIAAMAHIKPHIGDIVAFTPSTDPQDEDGTRLIVHRSTQFGCILDLSVLRRSGGSLVVESQVTEAGDSFRVHWAGERTSADNANCGRSADLVLDAQELDILALNAGGYGTGPKRLPAFINRSGV